MTYSPTKFEVATSNGLGGDTFTRNVTDGRTHGRTDGRQTDFDMKLIYPFFSKEKSGYNKPVAQTSDFPIGILGQVWCLIVLIFIPDLCPLSYF